MTRFFVYGDVELTVLICFQGSDYKSRQGLQSKVEQPHTEYTLCVTNIAKAEDCLNGTEYILLNFINVENF